MPLAYLLLPILEDHNNSVCSQGWRALLLGLLLWDPWYPAKIWCILYAILVRYSWPLWQLGHCLCLDDGICYASVACARPRGPAIPHAVLDMHGIPLGQTCLTSWWWSCHIWLPRRWRWRGCCPALHLPPLGGSHAPHPTPSSWRYCSVPRAVIVGILLGSWKHVSWLHLQGSCPKQSIVVYGSF